MDYVVFLIIGLLVFCAVQLYEIARQLVSIHKLVQSDFSEKYGHDRLVQAYKPDHRIKD